MAGIEYTTRSVPVSDISLNGGLNSTAGPLSLENNESPDLQNVDFSKFGSVLKRKGYATIASTTVAIAGSPEIDGLHWYEYNSSGTKTRKIMCAANTKVYKMDDVDGVWDDITGTLTITSGNAMSFENFLNEVYMTNNADIPFKWTGVNTGYAMAVPSGLTKAKFVREFNNYLFLGNVTVSGTAHRSRIYWSNLKNTSIWTATDFIEIAKDNGQEITGLKVLRDRLVVYKERSIYNMFFTGDADIPFILPGGGKSNSPVGCVAPYSIQDVDNGHVFFSYDGLYFYDGMNSFKISDKINDTIDGLNQTKFPYLASANYKTKNRYMLSVPDGASTGNDTIIVWDYFNNAFSVYKGINAKSMAMAYIGGTEERPYFGDYSGFVYRLDTGDDDYPKNARTAIDSYYYTNWKAYSDLVDKKAIPQVNIYYQIASTTLSFSWSYDFNDGDEYTQSFSLAAGTELWDAMLWGTGTWAKQGGAVKRRDLPKGRGTVVRFKFANNNTTESFRIDGFGSLPHLETNV